MGESSDPDGKTVAIQSRLEMKQTLSRCLVAGASTHRFGTAFDLLEMLTLSEAKDTETASNQATSRIGKTSRICRI